MRVLCDNKKTFEPHVQFLAVKKLAISYLLNKVNFTL